MDETVISALILTVLEEDLARGVCSLKSLLIGVHHNSLAAIEVARDEWLEVLLQLVKLLLGCISIVCAD